MQLSGAPRLRRIVGGRGKVLSVIKILRRSFGRLKFRRQTDPVGELVKTILSQNTNDANSLRAYGNLKKRFRNWEDLRASGLPEIKREIRIAGLANIKAPRIKGALNEIVRSRGALKLDFLNKLDLEEGYGYLRSIKGVGPKTAAIVLLFSFGKPIMPVDTHIYRVTRRLGLIDVKASYEEAQRCLTAATPQEAIKEFHVHLILHGRQVCTARKPRCCVCALRRLCKYYGERYGRQDVENRR